VSIGRVDLALDESWEIRPAQESVFGNAGRGRSDIESPVGNALMPMAVEVEFHLFIRLSKIPAFVAWVMTALRARVRCNALIERTAPTNLVVRDTALLYSAQNTRP
jgi:hypothetical protein